MTSERSSFFQEAVIMEFICSSTACICNSSYWVKQHPRCPLLVDEPDTSATSGQTEECAESLAGFCNCTWQHSCVWSGVSGGVLSQAPHVFLNSSVTWDCKLEILQLVHEHKIFISRILLQPLLKPWIIAQLESFFHKCVLAFWTCKTPRKSPFS